jgi:hypothetical protein
MPPGLTIPSTFIAIDRFSGPLRIMRGNLGAFVTRAETGLARVERGFRRALSPLTAFQNTLRGLGVYIGLFTAILLAKDGLNVMADFEQAQINIASVTEAKSVPQLRTLSSEARKVAVVYGQSAAAISSMQFELIKMGYTIRDAKALTEPITTGAVALRTTPERLQEVVGAVLKSHDMPVIDPTSGLNNGQKVVNQIAFVANATAAQFEDIATMLPIINRLTHKQNITFEQSLAVLGQLRNVQIHTSTGATSFKNILLDLKANSWEDLRKGMERVMKARDATAYSFNKFGKRSVISAIEIASMFNYIETLAAQAKGVEQGYTNILAAKQLDSIRGRISLFKAAYRELILSVDDGRGPFGAALKQYMDVGASMLLMGADSEAARSRLAMMDTTVIELANKYLSWLKIIGYVTVGLIALRVALLLWQAAVVLSKIAMVAWNIIVGISTALTWGQAMALHGNVVALTAYRIAVMIARIATIAFNSVMFATPLGAAVLGFGILISMILSSSSAYNQLTTSAIAANKATEKIREEMIAKNKGEFFDKPAYLERPGHIWEKHGDKWIEVVKRKGLNGIIDNFMQEQRSFGMSNNDMMSDSLSNMSGWPSQQMLDSLMNNSPRGMTPKTFDLSQLSKDLTPIKTAPLPVQDKKKEVLRVPKFDPATLEMMNFPKDFGVAVDINNKSGFPVTGRSDNANAKINIKAESTFEY